jgi:tetratricopeptide (TPR) repeat protein
VVALCTLLPKFARVLSMKLTNQRLVNLPLAFLLAAPYMVITAVNAQETNKLPQWKATEIDALELSGGAREHKLNQALEEAKACNQADAYPQSECLFELGVYFTDIGKTAQAEHYFSEAAELKSAGLKKVLSASGWKPGTMPAYSNPGQEHDGKVHDLANCLSWLGRAYFAEKKYEDAAHAFGRAIELLDTSKDPDHESIILPDTLLRAARIERLLNHLSEAKKMEERARYILSHRSLQGRQ